MNGCSSIEESMIGADLRDITDVHEFIASACHQLYLAENVIEKNLENNENHLNKEDSLCSATNGNSYEIEEDYFARKVLIERQGLLFCSECSFQTDSYKDFDNHCLEVHQSLQNILNNKTTAKFMYRCLKCLFVTNNFRGLRTHCTWKHKCDTEGIVETVPLSEPKAANYLRQFLAVADPKQRKQALKLFRHSFVSKPINGSIESFEIERVSQPQFNELQCLLCSFKSEYVNVMEEHYQEKHCQQGPSRDLFDNTFHCSECSFSSISYRAFHLHYQNKHRPPHINGFKCIVENNDTFVNVEKLSGPGAVKGLDQNNSEQITTLHCHHCTFSTESICTILNHWRSEHTRDYPTFVLNYLYKNHDENVIEIHFPNAMIRPGWKDGWMNKECTGLIKQPLYQCELCLFSTPSASGAMYTHFTNDHQHISRSFCKFTVVESAFEDTETNKSLCKQTTLLHCAQCSNYSSCFFKNMHEHYKHQHKTIFNTMTETELINEIRGSVITRCIECPDYYSTDIMQLLHHYHEAHESSIKTFSLISNSEKFEANCLLCGYSSSSLLDLSSHLEAHQIEFIENYEDHHVIAYCCSRCRRVFRHKRFLHFHFSRVHIEWSEDSFKLSDFPDQFVSVKAKNEEPMEVEKTSCNADHDDQDDKYDNKCDSSLQQTNQQQDENETSSSIDQLPSATYNCHLCNFSCNRVKLMQVHLKTEHNMPRSINVVKKKTTVRKIQKVFSTCSHLQYIDKNPEVYKQHVERLHNVEQPYKCKLCGNCYVCEVVLRMHVKKKHKHAKIIPIKKASNLEKKLVSSCSHYHSRLKKPELYETHIKLKHREEKPFNCPKCNRVYICKTIFLSHLTKKHHLTLNDRRILYCQKPFILHETANNALSSSESSTLVPAVTKPPVFATSTQNAIDYQKAKDYNPPKSVRTRAGHWRCIFCKQILHSYSLLRRHCVKRHPSLRLLKCRWCDFICRTNVQLTNHSRIHAKFVSERMKAVRQMSADGGRKCNNKKKKSLNVVDDDGENMEDDVTSSQTESASVASDEAEQSSRVLSAKTLKAKKSIKATNHVKSWSKPNDEETSVDVARHYSVTKHGTYRCTICGFVGVERSRVEWHVKSSHVISRTYKCKLCFFEHPQFDEIQSHLLLHHKMERNQHLAVGVIAEYGGKQIASAEETDSSDTDGVYTPSHSFPVAKLDQPLSTSEEMISTTNENILKDLEVASSYFIQNRSFKCCYCDLELASTYEIECHMTRHERCMLNSMDFDETSFEFAKFTTFLPPF